MPQDKPKKDEKAKRELKSSVEKQTKIKEVIKRHYPSGNVPQHLKDAKEKADSVAHERAKDYRKSRKG